MHLYTVVLSKLPVPDEARLDIQHFKSLGVVMGMSSERHCTTNEKPAQSEQLHNYLDIDKLQGLSLQGVSCSLSGPPLQAGLGLW